VTRSGDDVGRFPNATDEYEGIERARLISSQDGSEKTLTERILDISHKRRCTHASRTSSPCIIPVIYAPGSFPYLGDSYEQVDGLSHPHANPHMLVTQRSLRHEFWMRVRTCWICCRVRLSPFATLMRLSIRAKAAAIRHALVTHQAGLAPGTR
jgi:hypothetical protein